MDEEIKRDGHGRYKKGTGGGPGRLPKDPTRRIDRMHLAGAIRDMLEQEIDEESGLIKLLELIHAAYKKAKDGDSDAMKLLFERGYGKTPPVYQLDPRVLLEQLCVQHGLTIEDVQNDPIASWFFGLIDSDGGGKVGALPQIAGDQAGEGGEPEHEVLEPD